MKQKLMIIFLFAGLFFSTQTKALQIRDTTSSDRSPTSTYTSLILQRQSVTSGYQNAIGLPVGSVIAWPANVAMNSEDSFKYLECNGQTFDKNNYPELFDVLQTNVVPNLNNHFLRGTTNTAEVLKTYDDTIKSYDLKVDDHTHVWEGKLASNAVTGNLDSPAFTGDLQDKSLSAHLDNTATYGEFHSRSVSGSANGIEGVASHSATLKFTATTQGQTYDKIEISTGAVTVGGPYTDCYIDDKGIAHCTRYSSSVTSSVSKHNYAHTSSSAATGSVKGTVQTVVPAEGLSGGYMSDEVLSGLDYDDVSGGLVDPSMTGKVLNRHVTSHVINRTVAGTVADKTNHKARYDGRTSDGRDETAPMHMLVRYFIRAIP